MFKQGRQPLPILTQRSRLPPRYVKSGLAILVQHRLVSYLTSEDDNCTYYEADARNAYDLLRSGKNVHLLQHTIGTEDGGLTQKFCFEGSISASEIASLDSASVHDTPVDYTNGVKNGEKVPNGVNGHHHDGTSHALEHNERDEEPRELLFTRGYAVKARSIDYMSSNDFRQMVEDDIKKSKYGGVVRAKDKSKFQEEVRKDMNIKLGSNRATEAEVHTILATTYAQKRPHEDMEACTKRHPQQRLDSSRPQKQRKLNRGQGYDPASEEQPDTEMHNATSPTDAHDASEDKVGAGGEATVSLMHFFRSACDD